MSDEATPLLPDTSAKLQSDNSEKHEASTGPNNKKSTAFAEFPNSLEENEERGEGKIQGKRKIDSVEEVNQCGNVHGVRKTIKLENRASSVALPEIPGVLVKREYDSVLKEKVNHLLGKECNFPGAQPVSFTRNHIRKLVDESYFVCEKSDGIRVLVFLTEDDNQQKVYLIDRKNLYRQVEGMVFPDPDNKHGFQKETIFDGEIVSDIEEDESLTIRLYVFDCLVDRAKNLMSRSLQKRLGYFESHVLKPHIEWKRRENRKDLPFDLVCKPMVKAYHFDETYKKLPDLKHKSDGLIFTALSAPYKIGTCETMLKWKPPRENSVDFKLKLFYQNGKPKSLDTRPDKFELYENRGKKGYLYYGELCVEDEWEEWRKKEVIVDEQTSGERLNLDDRIVEVFLDESKKWRFLRFRDDKLDGNYFTIVRSILQSIEDGVSIEELRENKDKIYNEFVRREVRERLS